MKTAFAFVLVIHGLIHLLGFAKAFDLASVVQLQTPISRPLGALWLVAALLFLASAALLIGWSEKWWQAAVFAVVTSQVAIFTSWSDAKFGTLPNLVVLVVIAVSSLELRETSLRRIYARHVDDALVRVASTTTVAEEDLAPLPPLVQTYLRRVGVLGRPRAQNVYVRARGEFRSKPRAGWMAVRTEQDDFFDPSSRFFLMHGSMHGIPFEGLHVYERGAASMQVRAASVFALVDARGPEMNRSETVTLFNDMCLLAPASLLDASVSWSAVDERSVRGTFTTAGNTISAVLSFDADGDLVNFTSNDRDQSADGKTYRNLPWSTPVRNYKDFDGLRLAAYGEAVWHEPEGDFVYARLELEDVRTNVGAREGTSHLAEGAPAAVPRLRSFERGLRSRAGLH